MAEHMITLQILFEGFSQKVHCTGALEEPHFVNTSIAPYFSWMAEVEGSELCIRVRCGDGSYKPYAFRVDVNAFNWDEPLQIRMIRDVQYVTDNTVSVKVRGATDNTGDSFGYYLNSAGMLMYDSTTLETTGKLHIGGADPVGDDSEEGYEDEFDKEEELDIKEFFKLAI